MNRHAPHSAITATDRQGTVLGRCQDTPQPWSVYTPYGYCAMHADMPTLAGFNGEHPDALTGHYHLGNGYRSYSPTLMRFTRPDSMSPFGRGGINCYAYCAGDPINQVDPSGHFIMGALRWVASRMRAWWRGGGANSRPISTMKSTRYHQQSNVTKTVERTTVNYPAFSNFKAHGVEEFSFVDRNSGVFSSHGDMSGQVQFKGEMIPAQRLTGALLADGVDLSLNQTAQLNFCYSGYGGSRAPAQVVADQIGRPTLGHLDALWDTSAKVNDRAQSVGHPIMVNRFGASHYDRVTHYTNSMPNSVASIRESRATHRTQWFYPRAPG